MNLAEAEQWIAGARAAWTDETGASWAVDVGGRLVTTLAELPRLC